MPHRNGEAPGSAIRGRTSDPGAADQPAAGVRRKLFGWKAAGSPALTRLEQRYHVLPIGVADAASLRGQKLLLMAHPRAQPAEALVELDRWVRGGGHVLLLADPRLDWPSQRPLGDRLRPPPAFADTGLLSALGIDAERARQPDGLETAGDNLSSQWRLRRCVDQDRVVARCRIGKGAATVIADADFLNVEASAEVRPDWTRLLIASWPASKPARRHESRRLANNLIHRLVPQEQA